MKRMKRKKEKEKEKPKAGGRRLMESMKWGGDLDRIDVQWREKSREGGEKRMERSGESEKIVS